MNKEKNMSFIRGFSSITLSQICRDLSIDKSNLYHNKLSAINVERIKEEIEDKIARLYLKENK